MASGVWAGATDINQVHQIADIDDVNATVKSELERIGYLGPTPAHYSATPMAAHFELHIGMSLDSFSSIIANQITYRTRPYSRGL
jgi:hypothetical protein